MWLVGLQGQMRGSSTWAKCLLQEGVGHFSVWAVSWAGLKAFAAVSCLWSVVGKPNFVPRNVNIIYCQLINFELLILVLKQMYMYKDLGKTLLSTLAPILVSNLLSAGYTQSLQ